MGHSPHCTTELQITSADSNYKRSQQPANLTHASAKTARCLGLRHASLREPRDDR
jgi:hypothetical protein